MKSGKSLGINETALKPSLEEVFSPQGIAIVGASGSGKLGFAELVLYAQIQIGATHVFPVNPKYEEILGLPCYPSILDIVENVDHVVVNIPAGSVLELLEQCVLKKVKSVHFFTAGFGESGYSERVDLEQQMLEIARRGGFRIIGPNCTGLYVPGALVANIVNVPYDPGPIGFLSQSGGHASNLPAFSALRGLRFSKVISYGNALDVDEIEILDYMTYDDETDIIGVYIEGIKKGREFMDTLQQATREKPVIIYKGGKTEAGLRAAHGHTASMISSVDIFEAVCRQSNAIQADNLEEMQDVMVALQFLSAFPEGKNVVLFGSGGGPSVLAGDEMEAAGLRIPEFTDQTQEQLKSVLPIDGGIFKNPLDTVNLVEPDAIAEALNIFLDLPDFHMMVYHLGFHPLGMWGFGRFSDEKYLQQLTDVLNDFRGKCSKPILLALRPPQDLASMEEFLKVQETFVNNGFPVFHGLDKLALAMNRIIDWHARFCDRD
jgi:acetate---CoA ligase (ADP-forming) subunit alpha